MEKKAGDGGRPRKTILVVDDEECNRIVLQAYLGPLHDVLEAEDGASALELMGRERVDLVILDVMMPGLSGYELCKMLKSRAKRGFLPVLLVTALEDQSARNTGLEAGADDFLSKPVDKQELLLRVRSFLRLRDQEILIRRQLDELRHYQSLNESLFSLIVHDLRNPLGCVQAYARLTLDEFSPRLPAQAQEYVHRTIKSAEEMSRILDEVVKVRLLEQGKLPLESVPAVLSSVVRDAVETVRSTAESMDVRIEINPGEKSLVSLDYGLALRAIQILVTNALTFSPEGDKVSVAVVSDHGGAAVEVADRGPGVPDELKEDLFEKFGSVEAWRGQSRRGLGLGLHLVKLVATAHGGTVSVHDQIEGGSVFRLYFPGGG